MLDNVNIEKEVKEIIHYAKRHTRHTIQHAHTKEIIFQAARALIMRIDEAKPEDAWWETNPERNSTAESVWKVVFGQMGLPIRVENKRWTIHYKVNHFDGIEINS
jgi:hypothetical protein